jgi:hypothetical protein
MRTRIGWLAVLLALGVAVTPQISQAQGFSDVPLPSPQVPWPFGRPHLDQGGWYLAGEFLYMKQTNPLQSQPIGYRGLIDVDGTIHAALGLGNPGPGVFLGSRQDALDVNYISGPVNYQPAFNFTFGYRFESGIAVEMRWIHLTDVHYSSTAGIAPPGSTGVFQEETFVTSPVYNFTRAYAGPGNTTGQGSAIALLGIWDGANQMTEDFVQRFDLWELTMRVPLQESECWRTYGIMGPRLVSLWERFKWRTVNAEADGTVPPEDTAIYSNVVSNRLYGIHLGLGNEWMLGDTPVGAFSFTVDLQGAAYADFAKGRPKYELGDKSTAAQHGRNFINLVPEAEAQLNFWWYPYEGIVFRAGYQAMAFFNTLSSPRPVDFNFGTITPGYQNTFRLLDGFNFGFGIIF